MLGVIKMNLLKELTDLLDKNINTDSNVKKPIYEEWQYKNIYVFGAGAVGGNIYEILVNKSVNVKGFIVDENYYRAKEYYKKKIYVLQEMERLELENSLVIISLQSDEAIKKSIMERLLQSGVQKVLHFGDFCSDVYPAKYLDSNKIVEVFNYLEDDTSREVYFKIIQAITNADFSLFPKPSTEKQYFPNTIELKKGYDRFVDCGAFNGDTALELKQNIKNKETVEAIAYFEPDPGNYKELVENVAKHKFAKENIIVPCGVSDKLETLKFMDNCGTGVSGHISSHGETIIQTVAIDEIIPNFKPTCIKMDIEGSEVKALKGAERTIREYLPDLEICLYHDVKHLYEIPLLVKSINSNYKIFIRAHSSFFCETVMYATVNYEE